MTGSQSESDYETKEEPQQKKSKRNEMSGGAKRKSLKIALLGNATGLRVRCKHIEDGYVAEDSLM